jgi:hypothetical protein
MALPGNLTLRPVQGTYLNLEGTPLTGTVEFTIEPILTDPTAGVVIVPTALIAKLDANGHFSKSILTTDDPDTDPSGFRYKVVEKFTGATGRTFFLDVPGDSTDPIDLSNVATTAPPSGGTTSYATLAALTAEIGFRQDGDNELIARSYDIVNAGGFPYYVQCDDATDDTSALQTALYSCPEGGTVYVPVGKCRTSAPIIIPPHVTLQQSHANGEQLPSDTAPRSSIKPLASFVGDAVIKINDKLTAGYTDESREQRLINVCIDGSAVPGGTAVDGIKIYGYVQSVELRDVCIWKVTGNGIICLVNGGVTSGSQAPLAMKWQRVIAYEVGATGFIMFNATDCTFTDVLALGCNGDGWYIEGPANSTFAECRAEWSSGEGFKLQPKFGPVTFSGCSTDRNDKNGISIIGGDWDSSVIISGARLNRDGRNGGAGGGGYSGLRVDTNCPVLVSGIMVNARRDDNTTGPLGPDYGVSAINSQEVILQSGYLNAIVGGFNDLGGNSTLLRGANVEEKIGNMIGTATVHKRGVRADLTSLAWFDNTGVETNLLRPANPVSTDQNIAAWSIDFALPTSGAQITAGQIHLTKVILSSPRSISKLAHHVFTAGATLTAAQNLIGLYNAAGLKLAQCADQATAWTTVGYKNPALVGGALNLAAGTYYIALLSNGTTPPFITRAGSGAGSLMNAELAATALRSATYGTGQTTLPTNLTLASMAVNSALFAVGLVA